jgi:hypothetical protein
VKVEAWIFGLTTGFFVLVTPAYWFITGANLGQSDWTGSVALAMTTLLAAMITLYLGFHARKMEPRPEDRPEADIAEGAGELGFFPPYSWWPLWCAMCAAAGVYGIAMDAWWLVIIAAGFGFVALCGWVFEYYRGDYAH